MYLFADDLSHSYTAEHTNWKEIEIEYFRNKRDKNGDGHLDKDELRAWLYPPSSDPAVNEAEHLFYHADKDKVIFF